MRGAGGAGLWRRAQLVRARVPRSTWIVLAVALTLRVAWVIFAFRAPPAGLAAGDQYSYWYYGNEIADGRGYIAYTSGEPTAYYPIGYPVVLAAVFFVIDHLPLPVGSVRAVGLVQALFGTASVLLVWVISRRAFANDRVALVAAAILAVYPSAIYGVATFSLETVFSFVTLAALAIVATHQWASGASLGTARAITFGVTVGLAAMVRPFALAVLVALAIASLVARVGWRSLLRPLAWSSLTVIVVLTPWTVRNAVRMDAFVPFSTNVGDTMCLARYPGSDGGFRFATHEWCADDTLPEAERNPANIRAALTFIRDHPGEEIRLVRARLWLMMETDRTTLEEVEANGEGAFLGQRVRSVLGALADVVFFASLALAVVGAAILARHHRRRPAAIAVAVTAGVLLVIPLGLWGNPRFHAPIVPFIAMLAALPLVAVAQRGIGRASA